VSVEGIRARLAAQRPRIEARADLTRRLRAFFERRGFLEVETPRLTAHGTCEPYIEPFITSLEDDRGKNRVASLIPSPEIHMKKLVASGYERIWELARVFRNHEPLDSPWHNHQFSLLEWYRRGEPYETIMEDAQALILELAGRDRLDWNGRGLDLSVFERLTVREAFRRFAGIDFDRELAEGPEGYWGGIRRLAERLGHGRQESLDDAFYLLFLNHVEPGLAAQDHPVFLHEYPAFQAAFSRLGPDPRYGERVELYLAGVELGNGYGELVDGEEQRKRLQDGNRIRAQRGVPVLSMDPDFPQFLPEMGMTSGMAIGWDRLVMLLTGATSIDEVLLFPDREIFARPS